jgi:chemotaxis protein CheX
MTDASHSPVRLALAESLDLKAASALASDLLALRGQDLAIDAGAVRRIGAQCLQVLLAARATWDGEGHRLTFEQPSDEFRDGVSLLGAPELADPALTPTATED